MILIDLWEWSINLFLISVSCVLIGVGFFIFLLMANYLTNWLKGEYK
jgi:hypothetical protein